MTPSEELALSFVRKHKPRGPTELAQLMGLSRVYAHDLLKSLKQQGLVVKTEPRWTVK